MNKKTIYYDDDARYTDAPSDVEEAFARSVKIMFVFALFFIYGCSKEDNSDKNITDDPYNEQGLVLINKVSEQCGDYVESYLQQYFSQNGKADINDLVNKIKNIDEVEEASPNDDNSLIRIKLKNGACYNHLIFSRDDDRLITEESNSLSQSQQLLDSTNYSNSENSVELRSTASAYNTPTAKTALILAPFQSQFQDNLSTIAMYLNNAGYVVTTKVVPNITINDFRGDFLNPYGVIYIATHGGHDMYNLSLEKTSMVFLATPIKYNSLQEAIASFGVEDRKMLGLMGLPNGREMYLAVSEKWISRNLNSLPSSLVYIEACYSAINKQLPTIFLKNGAKVCLGWTGSAPPHTASFTTPIFENFSKGLELDVVYSNINWPNWYKKDIRYKGFTFYKANPNVPFYLIKNEVDITPVVSIPDVTSTTATVTVTINAAEVFNQHPTATQVGCCYSTSSTFTTWSNEPKTPENNFNKATNTYTFYLKDLTPGTPYFIYGWVKYDDPTTDYPYVGEKKDAIPFATKKPDESAGGVLINGLKWATRNVGAANPEDPGANFQWNRGTTSVLSKEDYYNQGYAQTYKWLSVNNPCPSGFRVPSPSELSKLSSYVNGVKVLTIPYGNYWSNTRDDWGAVWLSVGANGFWLNDIMMLDITGLAHVRCVAE